MYEYINLQIFSDIKIDDQLHNFADEWKRLYSAVIPGHGIGISIGAVF